MISGATRLCGIIGDPIEHTMSPAMHNAAFRELGLDYVYVPFRVLKGEVEQAVRGMRALNIRGLNVTIPHKIAVIPFLDEVDATAEKIGAVNTIVNDDGVLRGYNTDATGFMQALLEKGIDPGQKSVVVLGAGGASRAICSVLAERGSKVAIMNRSLERARGLAEAVSASCGNEVGALALNGANLARALGEAEVLVNASSVGMSPGVDESPVDARLLRSDLVVFDIVYSPLRTRLLREAGEAGAETIGGLDMLVWQGAMAFEKWVGVEAPLETMRAEVVRAMGEDED